MRRPASRPLLAAATALAAVAVSWAVLSVPPTAPATAAHPCAADAPADDPCRSSTHGTPSTSPSDRPDCADPCPDVVLGVADDGRTVSAQVGHVVEVRLDGGAWDGPSVDAPGLFRSELTSSSSGAHALFRAVRSGRFVLSAEGDTSCARADPACPVARRTWTVGVDVVDGTPPTPRPSASPTPSCAVLVVDPAPGTLYLSEGSSGTHTVERDQAVLVYASNDCNGSVFRLPSSSGGLFRDSAREDEGASHATYRPQRTGEFELTGYRDAACSHEPAPCARPAVVWHVTVRVVEPGECAASVDPPAAVRVGTPAVLSGRAGPGEPVTVQLRRRGQAHPTETRAVTADGSGRWSVRALLRDDHGVVARIHRCASAEQVLRVLPTIQGPTATRRGQRVTLVVAGPPGVPVQVLFRRAGSATFVVRRWGTTGPDGRYTTSYVADADHRWYARTGPGSRTTAAGLTQVR